MGTNDTQMGIEGISMPAAQVRRETAERRNQHLSFVASGFDFAPGVSETESEIPTSWKKSYERAKAFPIGRQTGDGSFTSHKIGS